MDQIRTQVEQARRRLWMELFIRRSIMCCFVALVAALIAIAVPKVVAIENLPSRWALGWIVGALAVGELAALAWTFFRGQSELDAAMEIDRRFELKERIASCLSLPDEAVATPAGQALMHDAERAVRRLQIDERFRINPGRRPWLPLAPAAAALLLALFVANRQAESSVETTTSVSPKALQTMTENLRKRRVEIAKKDPTQGLREAEALLLEMERELEKLAKQDTVDRKKTLVKLNNLARQLEQRREKLGGDGELRRQLANLKDMASGPGDKMAEALKNGDWKQASEELQKLADQLKKGELTDAQKKQLAEQLKQLERQLAEAAAKRERAMDELERQIEQAKRDGNLARAGQLQEKLDRMMRQQQQAQQLERLAQQLARAQQSMEAGDQQAAAQAMSQMMQQLQDLQQSMDQMAAEAEMLQMAMEQLEMARDAMSCSECEGEGCEMCMSSMMSNMMTPRSGMGMGEGRGRGPRPDEETDTSMRSSQVRQKPGQGSAVVTGEAEGPTVRGNVREAVREEMEAAEAADDDALVIEQMPRTHRENAEDYFNRFREGR